MIIPELVQVQQTMNKLKAYYNELTSLTLLKQAVFSAWNVRKWD